MKFNSEGYSTSGLLMMHNGVRTALATDDALPESQKPYLVRKHPDWKMQADEIEAELDKRKVKYQKIKW